VANGLEASFWRFRLLVRVWKPAVKSPAVVVVGDSDEEVIAAAQSLRPEMLRIMRQC